MNSVMILSMDEGERLAALEIQIAQGITTFIQVGIALAEIRSSGLYREHFKTFEEYCRVKWRMAARTAYQMISSSGTCQQFLSGLEMPANESIARVLTNLDPTERRDMWLLAIQNNQHCTAERLKTFLKSLRKIDYEKQRLSPVTQAQCPQCAHVYELVQPEKASRGSRIPSWSIKWAASTLTPGLEAVDYGCGRFRNTKAIQAAFRLVASVDTFIQCQRIRAIAPEGASVLTVEDFEASKIQSPLVFLVSVIHIIPEFEVIAVIARIKRHLRPGGHCLVEFPRNATYYRTRARNGLNTQGGYYREPTEAELSRWFDGFDEVGHSRKGYSLAKLYRYRETAHNCAQTDRDPHVRSLLVRPNLTGFHHLPRFSMSNLKKQGYTKNLSGGSLNLNEKI